MTLTQWAKQFAAITASDIENFNQTVDNNLSLHDKKRLFTEQYQDKITFSYILQVEKNIVKDFHIENTKESRDGNGSVGISGYQSGYEYGYGCRNGSGYGEKYGDEYGDKDGSGYGDGYEDFEDGDEDENGYDGYGNGAGGK